MAAIRPESRDAIQTAPALPIRFTRPAGASDTQQPAISRRHGGPVTKTTPEPADERPPLWTFVPLAEHAPPALAVHSAAMQAWQAVKKALRRDDEEDKAPARQEQALRSLSNMRLAHLVRPIDWKQASLALDDATKGAAAASTVTFVIGPPHAGHAEIVEAWAARHEARLIEPPSAAQILRDDKRWHPSWKTKGTWALPRLVRCFLRHANGLSLVRRLLEEVASGRAGHGVIGCDSWTWAFLQRVWPLPQPHALALQALDAARLQRLFVHLAPRRRGHKLRFRDARTGDETLTVPYEGESLSRDIVLLAAHCRGNAGLAREYWRRRLRTEPDADADADAADDDSQAAADGDETVKPGEQVIWVSAKQDEPVLPGGAGEDMSLLLHALLIHGGLADAMLGEVLPLPLHVCVALLLRLQQQGLVEQRDGLWIVTPLAYIMVRSWLRGRDFLTDEL